MRVEVHVRPNSSRAGVGGTHDGALVVRVVEPADAGRASDATLRAVAQALVVPRRSVTLLRGATNRRKLLEIDVNGVDARRVTAALQRLGGMAHD